MDWQSIIVALSVLAALAFVGRRAWMRLQSVVRARAGVTSSCAGACGGCASEASDKRIPEQKVVYQILPQAKFPR
jgi:hypothetical protein